MNKKSQKKILCHVGPWCVQQYTQIAKSIDPDCDVVLLSHFLEIDQTEMAREYYRNLEVIKSPNIDIDFDLDDFIQRCRVLRSLKKEDAILHLFSMKLAVADALDRERPDIVISEVIDQYLIDLLRYECDLRGIPFFGLVVSFANGYFRITARGEVGKIRSVGKKEIDTFVKEIERSSYTPNFVFFPKTWFARSTVVILRMISNWARLIYFTLKIWHSGEKFNYHYLASKISARMNFHIIPKINLGTKNWELTIKNQDKPIIYHPLQMYPEATIDYWCNCLSDIDYDKKLVHIIKSFANDFHFLIKEHPNVLGLRSPNLYKSLFALNNVTIVPTHIDSNLVLDRSQAVLVWTGSTGFEAAIRGKPVLTICEPYYAQGPNFKKINEHSKSEDILKHIEENTGRLNFDEKFYLISSLLAKLRPGRYINDASWNIDNADHRREALEIGNQIVIELKRMQI